MISYWVGSASSLGFRISVMESSLAEEFESKIFEEKKFKRSYLNGTDLSFVDEYFILCSSFFNGVWVKMSTIASTSPIALCLSTIAKYNGYIKNMTKGKIRLLPTS